MELDWKFLTVFLPSLLSAASGLGGVWLGANLTSQREARRELEAKAQDLAYLAILVNSHLDRFVDRCVAVSFDDGTHYGAPARADGTYEPTEPEPEFDPLTLDVKWKILPPELMYGILSLPQQVEVLQRYTHGIAEHDGPPDYSEYFHARQGGFARLGIYALGLARQLRMYAQLPPPLDRPSKWDRETALREQSAKYGERDY